MPRWTRGTDGFAASTGVIPAGSAGRTAAWRRGTTEIGGKAHIDADVENATGCESVEGVRVVHRVKTSDGQSFDIDGNFTVSIVFLDDAGNEL